VPLVLQCSGGRGGLGRPPDYVGGDMEGRAPGGGTGQTISDLVRWTNPIFGLLAVYSDRPEPGEIPDLADVGISNFRMGNLVHLDETGPEGGLNGVFGYTPTPGMPGFLQNSANNPATYNFISDAVPEPGSLSLLAAGALLLLRRRRR